MNYLDLQHHVISTNHSLQYVDMFLVHQYLTNQWELRHASSLDQLTWLQHPSIKCVTHCLMHYDSRRIHTVKSVVVDGVVAFFFIAGGREGGDYYTGYVLSTAALKHYVKYLAVIAIELWYQTSTGFLPQYLPEVTTTDTIDKDMVEVDQCTTISGLTGKGIHYLYGVEYTREADITTPPMKIKARY